MGGGGYHFLKGASRVPEGCRRREQGGELQPEEVEAGWRSGPFHGCSSEAEGLTHLKSEHNGDSGASVVLLRPPHGKKGLLVEAELPELHSGQRQPADH